jgi:hypothetical protein
MKERATVVATTTFAVVAALEGACEDISIEICAKDFQYDALGE